MKYIYLILWLCSTAYFSFAQNRDAKRDYYWHSGYSRCPATVTTYGDYRFCSDYWDYNYTPVRMDTIARIHTNDYDLGGISEVDGSPLLFTNGCRIVDKNDNTIIGTEQMNAGYAHDRNCPPNRAGYITSPGMIVLPNPRDTNSFHFFHVRLAANTYDFSDRLVTTKIDRTTEREFRMAYTDSLVILDTMELGHIAACRHANGRDWWIIQPRGSSNKYYKILYDGTFNRITTQQLGVASTFYENVGGQAWFSPDGKKFARYNVRSDIRIFDFDRCSGELSNPIHIPIYDRSDTTDATGCAFSPNSRYLYVSSSSRIYQFDMQAANIAASKITVLNYDFSRDTTAFSEQFHRAILGPDGKIYITASEVSSRDMHYIEYPDSAGLSCRAVQAKFTFKQYYYISVPAFPNFRLGALRGSPCDTLTVATQDLTLSEPYALRLFPNPARDNLNIDLTMPTFDNQRCELRIFDVAGKMLYYTKMSDYTPIHNVDIRAYSSGTYFVQLYVNGQKQVLRRFVVVR
jgi:Secretion system C-terminal sorting domain